MHIIFLAAGRGSRMGALTDNVPKALLPLTDGRSILESNLLNLRESAPDCGVVVVGGHGWDAVRRFCRTNPSGVATTAIFNPDYATAGPIRSISAALAGLPDTVDAIAVANGDTIFSAGILSLLGSVSTGIGLVMSRAEDIGPDEMGVVLDPAGRVAEATKSDVARRSGLVSAGLLLARGASSVQAVRDAVEAVAELEVPKGRLRPWHDLLHFLGDAGMPATSLLVDRSEWHEFDYAECIARYTGT